jgi:hypothetical protein
VKKIILMTGALALLVQPLTLKAHAATKKSKSKAENGWVDCRKLKGPGGKVIIQIDAKGKWLCKLPKK